jgi:protein phosphatase
MPADIPPGVFNACLLPKANNGWLREGMVVMIKKVSWLIIIILTAVLCGNTFVAYALTPDPDADADEFTEHAREFWDEMLNDEIPDEEEPANLFADYWWAFAVGGGIIVLGGAGFVMFKIKKKKPVIVRATTPETNHYPVMIGNMHHIGARESQQDSFCISDISNAGLCARKGILGVAADGMGGMADGAETSAIVTRTFLQYFNEAAPSGHPELDLLVMVNAANDNINRFMSGRDKGGSTVVAVIIHDRKLHWVAVGDSRIYLIRNGAIMQLNREHVYSVELDEKAAAGEISWETAAGDSRRDALTSYLGMKVLEKIDRCFNPMQLLEGDRILLMSDGVFGALTDEEILSAMPHPPQEIAMLLQEMVLAKQNPNQDNFTAIILEYRGNPK